MFNDLEAQVKEEAFNYTDEEIHQIQARARKRADEFMIKFAELTQSYMIDPEAENESESSAIYTATFMDRYCELLHNMAPNPELQKKADDSMKTFFQ